MKAIEFIKYLSNKEKAFFFINKIFSKIQVEQFMYLATTQNILNKAKQIGFEITQDKYYYKFSKKDFCIKLRKDSSDLEVFNQVFIDEEYAPVIKLLLDNDIEVNYIIDAGSNIGLTSLLLFNNFKKTNIICLEPDAQNYAIAKQNLNVFIEEKKCILLQKALWRNNQSLVLTNDFRDGRDWSRRVIEHTSEFEVGIQGITIDSLIVKYSLKEISLLKIDIEGSEGEIFSKINNLDFLNIIKIIALEIHDEVCNRKQIYDILTKYNFFLINAGELTIGVNKTFIK